MEHYKKIILIGDSLIEQCNDPNLEFSFSSALAYAFLRKADVVNRGISGYNSTWMEGQIQRIIEEFSAFPDDVRICALLLGTNDSVLPGNEHHVQVDKFKHNLQIYVEKLSKMFPKCYFILVTPPPCCQMQLQDPSNKLSSSGKARNNETVLKYVGAVEQVYDQLNSAGKFVKMINLFHAINESHDSIESYLTDGVHLNGNGYSLLFNKLIKCLEQLDLDWPMVEPHWRKRAEQAEQNGE